MKFTEEQLKGIPALYEQDGKGDNTKVFLRVHIGSSGYEWLITEYDKEQELFFGFACLNDPEMAELGYISKIELEELGGNYPLQIEQINLSLKNAKDKFIFKES